MKTEHTAGPWKHDGDIRVTSAHPFHPQGFGQHGDTRGRPCDTPNGWPALSPWEKGAVLGASEGLPAACVGGLPRDIGDRMNTNERLERAFRNHGLLIALFSASFLGALFALAVVAVREVIR